MLKVLDKDGRLYGEREVFMDALILGDEMALHGDSFFIKDGKKQSSEIDFLFRSEIPKYRAIKNAKLNMERMS